MSNTVIQIKRSSTTAVPSDGSLAAAELAYSYNSQKLFIGTANGLNTLLIGGQYVTDMAVAGFGHANNAFLAANAAFDYANTISSDADEKANAAIITANVAFDKANSANLLAYNTGIGANAFASATIAGANAAVGLGANTFALDTFLPYTGGTISGDLVVQGNTVFSGNVIYANTQTLLIGDNILSLNADLPGDVAPSEDAGLEIVRGSSANVYLLWNEGTDKWQFTNNGTTYFNIASNTDVETSQTIAIAAFDRGNVAPDIANSYAAVVGSSANTFLLAVIAGANTAVGTGANTYADAVSVAANSYADMVGAAANTNAANASYLSVGTVPSARISGSYTGITGVGVLTVGTWNADTVKVPYGGTGMTTFTQNGILFGNTAGDLKVTSAGTEGQVLQADAAGIPQFGHLDGGEFN